MAGITLRFMAKRLGKSKQALSDRFPDIRSMELEVFRCKDQFCQPFRIILRGGKFRYDELGSLERLVFDQLNQRLNAGLEAVRILAGRDVIITVTGRYDFVRFRCRPSVRWNRL